MHSSYSSPPTIAGPSRLAIATHPKSPTTSAHPSVSPVKRTAARNDHTPPQKKRIRAGGEPAKVRGFVNAPSSGSSSSTKAAADDAILQVRKRLPIWAAREAIVQRIRQEETVILMADTGSGKSTQIPQFLHEAGFTSSPIGKASPRIIGITQPRRMAALSLAKRVAQELGTADPGEDDNAHRSPSLVGFAIRFQDRTTKHTRIKFMTDGWLLREFVKASTRLLKDGITLDQVQDPSHEALLPQYSVLIIDEAHERTVRSDLLLGLAKRIQRRRRELREAWEQRQGKGLVQDGDTEPELLRMVIMSATIDAELFSNFFATEERSAALSNGQQEDSVENTSGFRPAPVLYVKGRTHPVTLHHLRQPVEDWVEAAKRQVLHLHVSRPCGPTEEGNAGDILVFGTGAEEIEALAAGLRQLGEHLPAWASDQEKITGRPHSLAKLIVVPLYAALGSKAVAQVYKPTPAGYRKVIVATNIAETSVTIPGIRYVIDCGLAKERMHISEVGRMTSNNGGTPSTVGTSSATSSAGIETLTTRPISKSAALQRAGRAGREAPGECYRLYPASAFEAMELTTLPEIHRSNLGSVALDCFSAGVDPRELEWVEPPQEGKLRDAVLGLAAMGALKPVESPEGERRLVLTSLGRKMSLLPLAPQFSLLLITAADHYSPKTVRQARDLVAILSSERNIFMDVTLHGLEHKDDHSRSSNGNGVAKGEAERMREEMDLLDLKRSEADKAKRVFRHHTGDHITMLRAFYKYLKVKAELYAERGRKFRNNNVAGKAELRGGEASPEARLKLWCSKHFVNLRSMKEVEDVRDQLVGICRRAGIQVQEERDDGEAQNQSTRDRGGRGSSFKRKKRTLSHLQGSSSSDSSEGDEEEEEEDDPLTVTKGPRHSKGGGDDDQQEEEDGVDDENENYDDLLRCLVQGRSASNVAARIEEGEHRGHFRRILGNEIFRLHPTSSLSRRNLQASSYSTTSNPANGRGSRGTAAGVAAGTTAAAPKYILFEELQYTASLYARCVSEVQIEWLSASANGNGNGNGGGDGDGDGNEEVGTQSN